MKRKICIHFLLFLTCSASYAQLVINSGLTPQQLANGIAGQGITVSGITFTGDPSMGASFTATGTNLGLTNGILLATGTANIFAGPNTSQSTGTDMFINGDPVLDNLANTITYDACILEFDFIPQSSIVSFRYVFGSEEYPEFVCSQYNDVFAFFISGPGISGSMNMALVPGTSTPVAINTVNVGVSGTNATPGTPCGLTHSNLYVNNTPGATVEFDGFTIPMVAQAIVQPCQTYHLRIMIADAGDGVFDSGVFIEGGSLFSNPVVNAGIDQNFCSGGNAVLGINSAPGYSYNWIPSTGLSNTAISNPTLTLVNNGNSPITTTYVVTANSGTCLFTDTVNVIVNPAPAASFSVNPSQACAGEPITINYTGTQASNYNWSFGNATILSGSGGGPYQISYSAAGIDSVFITATNPGCSGNAAQSIFINPIPDASFSIQPDACPNQVVQIVFNGSASQNANYIWDFSGGQIFSGTGAGPYQVSWLSPGLHTISLSLTDNNCISSDFMQINIAQQPVAFAGNDATVCANASLLLGETSQPGYSYQWIPTTGLDDATLSNPTSVNANTGLTALINNYTVTITNQQGCTSSDNVMITVNPGINVDFVTNGNHCLPDNKIDFTIQAAYPAGSMFNWDFGSDATPSTSSQANQNAVSYSTSGTHVAVLNATSGNCAMTPVIHEIEIYDIPSVDFMTDDLQGCSPLQVDLKNLSADVSNNFYWTISDGSSSHTLNTTASLVTPGFYDVSLIATSAHGCSKSVSKKRYITVYATPFSSFATNPSVASIESPVIFLQNNSQYADEYFWSFGDSTTSTLEDLSHVYPATGIYTISLVARNSFGCIDTSFGTIEINEGFSFFIPNSFTPDGDGKNDFFQGYGINFKSYEMSIYNRWGVKIYETSEYLKPWDGTINEREIVQNEVFVYKILITDKFNEPHNFVGSVTMIK